MDELAALTGGAAGEYGHDLRTHPGYNNLSHFSRAFKRFAGMSPKQLQQMTR